MNGLLRSLFRKVLSQMPGSWSDWLPDILWAIRVLVSRTHGFSPFRLAFKQEPLFPDHLALYEGNPGLPLDLDILTETEMVEELERIWDQTVMLARQKLAAGDERMKREYMQRHKLLEMEIPFYFKAGDWVLLK